MIEKKDKKIIEALKEEVRAIRPSEELSERIKNSYQKINKQSNLKINFKEMFNFKKMVLAGGVLSAIIIAGGAFVYYQNSNYKLAKKETEEILPIENIVGDDLTEIVADIDEEMDTLAMIENKNAVIEKGVGIEDLSELENLDDLSELDDLDDLDLDEDMFDDELFL
jgi:hypothetical protein